MKQFIFSLSVLVFSGACGQNPDIDLLKSINVDRNTNLDPTFIFVSNSVAPLAIAVPLGMISYAIITKDSTDRSHAILICSSVLIAGIVSTSMKYGFDRERPFDTYSFIQPVVSADGPSFPSGHTSTAFALATSLSMSFPKWYVISGSYLWAASVGYSRMHLGVHYPSDVLVGAIVGTGSAFLSRKLTRWINSKGKKQRH